MPQSRIELHVDRDSVAMGDDMVSHAKVVTVREGTRLKTALQSSLPDIRAKGWSWVAVVDGEVSAVWSVDHGIRLLVENRRLTGGPVDILFRYFLQIDPAWLFDRLAAGAPARLLDLEAEYAAIAREKREAELRRRERTIKAKLLGAECIDAIAHYGAKITLHADIACRFTYAGEQWTVRRADTMLQMFTRDGATHASIRPHGLGEAWVVGMLAASARVAEGRPDLPDADFHPGLELERRGNRWMSHGATVVQVESDFAADVARLVFGRPIAEVRPLFDG